jgi:hypothetical protein
MDYPNIAICSYNLNWEIMDIKEGKLTREYTVKELEQYKSNILENIQNIHDYYNPQIYCFQEAANYTEVTKIFNPDIFKHHVNISGPELMLTIWDSTRFELLNVKSSGFESGRPFCIFVFKDILVGNTFILINIHAGHRTDTYKSIFRPIQKILDKSKLLKNYNISRIIIGGDFNRNINEQIKSSKELILINDSDFDSNSKQIFNFQYTNKKLSNTCCSISGKNLKNNFDFVIDSLDSCILRHELNKESWYLQPASDHIMIMSIIKKYYV